MSFLNIQNPRPEATIVEPLTQYSMQELLRIFESQTTLCRHLKEKKQEHNREYLYPLAQDLLYYILPAEFLEVYHLQDIVFIGGESLCLLVKHSFMFHSQLVKIANYMRQMPGREFLIRNGPRDSQKIYINEDKERFIRGAFLQSFLSTAVPREICVIPTIYNCLCTPAVYAIMEYIQGPRSMAWAKDKDFSTVFNYVYRLALSLKTLHDIGVVHRDIKPENMLVLPGSKYNYISLLDFSSAMPYTKEMQDESHYMSMLKTTTYTEIYCSPMVKTNSSVAQPCDDIYSLLKTSWSLFVGEEPKEASGFRRELLPHGFETIYDRGVTNYMAEGSYTNCDELLQDLRDFAVISDEVEVTEIENIKLPQIDLERAKTVIGNIYSDIPTKTGSHIAIDDETKTIEMPAAQDPGHETAGDTSEYLVVDFDGIKNEDTREFTKALVKLIIQVKESGAIYE